MPKGLKGFQEGKSGNPGGRPKTDPELRAIFKAACPAAARRLIQLSKSDDERIALHACIATIERTYGKPAQELELSGKDGIPLVPIINIVVDGVKRT